MCEIWNNAFNLLPFTQSFEVTFFPIFKNNEIHISRTFLIELKWNPYKLIQDNGNKMQIYTWYNIGGGNSLHEYLKYLRSELNREERNWFLILLE